MCGIVGYVGEDHAKERIKEREGGERRRRGRRKRERKEKRRAEKTGRKRLGFGGDRSAHRWENRDPQACRGNQEFREDHCRP